MDFKKRVVAVLLFKDVELLDFAGPYEVFTSVLSLPDRQEPLMQVFTVAETTDPVRSYNGLAVLPDFALDNCPTFDILLVPGGSGTRTFIQRPELVDWIRRRSQSAELTASVCTGSFILAQAGLLDGRSATTYWERVNQMRADFPMVDVVDNARWVDEGHVISSSGVSAGIDMALYVVQRLYGPKMAQQTAREIEYEYWPVS